MDTIASPRRAELDAVGAYTAFDSSSYVEWPTIFAGAVVALAISGVLLTFGSAIGFAAISPWTSTATSVAVVSFGAVIWMILVNIWSFALGGYLSARMRHRRSGATAAEVEFRDGAHGAIVWGLAITSGALVAALVAASVARSGLEIGAATISNEANAFATDTLLRTVRPQSDIRSDETRAEIGRLLLRQKGPGTLVTADRAHLAQLVAARTGLTPADADKRVDEAIVQVKDAANRARKAAVVLGFVTAATLLLGAAAAWWGATMGGKHRDEGTVWPGLRGQTVFSNS